MKKDIESVRTRLTCNPYMQQHLREDKEEVERYIRERLGVDLGKYILENEKELPVKIAKFTEELPYEPTIVYEAEVTLISKDRLRELLHKERILENMTWKVIE